MKMFVLQGPGGMAVVSADTPEQALGALQKKEGAEPYLSGGISASAFKEVLVPAEPAVIGYCPL